MRVRVLQGFTGVIHQYALGSQVTAIASDPSGVHQALIRSDRALHRTFLQETLAGPADPVPVAPVAFTECHTPDEAGQVRLDGRKDEDLRVGMSPGMSDVLREDEVPRDRRENENENDEVR